MLAAPAWLCVLIFALCSLLFLPIEIAYYFLQRGIEFGIKQEKAHSERRIKIEKSWVRSMVRLSIKSWRDQVRDAAWWKRVFWGISFVPALMYAYIAHHLDPRVKAFGLGCGLEAR
jgi:hypothetical protein